MLQITATNYTATNMKSLRCAVALFSPLIMIAAPRFLNSNFFHCRNKRVFAKLTQLVRSLTANNEVRGLIPGLIEG